MSNRLADLEQTIKEARERMAQTGEPAFTAACTVMDARQSWPMSAAAIAWAAEHPQPKGESVFPCPEPMTRPPLRN